MVIIQNSEAGNNARTKWFYGVDTGTNGVSAERYTESNYTYARSFLAKCSFGYFDGGKYTVTWLDADGNTIETDENVPAGTMPEYNGTIAVPDGYTLFWTNGTNTYRYNSLPNVIGNVTYTVVLLKNIAVGDVYYAGDTVDFGNCYINDNDYNGNIAPCYGVKTIFNIEYRSDYGQYRVSDENGNTIAYVTSENYGENVGLKVTGGDGTHDNPYAFEIVPYTDILFYDVNGIKTTTYRALRNEFTADSLELPAPPYLDGYNFTGWKVNDTVYTADTVKNAVAELVEAGTEVNVQPVYEKKADKFTVTVVGGTFEDDTHEGLFNVSDQIFVYATEVPDGQKFSYWAAVDVDGNIVEVGYETTYAFKMPSKNVTLTAVYVDNDKPDTEKSGTAYIESITKPAENKLSFVSIVSVPDDMRILRAGVVANTEKTLNNEELTINNTRFQSYNSTACNKYTTFKYTFTKGNVKANEVWCVRAYLMYTDKQGGVYTIYGDMVKADLNGEITA